MNTGNPTEADPNTTDTGHPADSGTAVTDGDPGSLKADSTDDAPKPDETTDGEPDDKKATRKGDKDYFFEVEQEDGTVRKYTLNEFKKLQGELTKANQRVSDVEKRRNAETSLTTRQLERFKIVNPEGYQQFIGLNTLDDDTIKSLPVEMQAEILVEKREQEKIQQQLQQEQYKAIEDAQQHIANRLEEMADDPDGYPDYDENAVVEYAIENRILDPLIAYKTLRYDELISTMDERIQSAKEEAILEYKKDIESRGLTFHTPSSHSEAGSNAPKEKENLSARDRLIAGLGAKEIFPQE